MAVRRMLLVGRYRLREPVGTGGMGRVWLARDEMLDRDVAIKEFVPPEWMTDAEKARLRDRTLREARSAARIDHPHVVKIYDVVHAEDKPWIVMEYVPSRSLHQVLRDDGPYEPEQAARIGLDVLEAITAAHRAGVLHRDVKPHNVLIATDGRVVLTDFGLATFVDDGSVTGPGLVVGSPHYVSPERAKDGASTVEADLWSFGATLFATVEGRSPFARENAMATLMALATEEPDPPRRAGPLTPVLTGLLRREPTERLTAREVEQQLRAVTGMMTPYRGHATVPGQRQPAPVETLPEHPSAPLAVDVPPPRRWLKVALSAAAAVVVLAGAGAFLLHGKDQPPRARPAAVLPSSVPAAGVGGFSPVNCLAEAPAGLPRTPQRGADKLRGDWALYPGWSYFAEGTFHIAVPDGWSYQRIGTTLCFRDPSAPRVLSVDASRNPKGDPVEACRDEVARLRATGNLPGYHQYGISRVPALTRAADWEYAFDDRTGTRQHSITRWVASDGKGYAYALLTRDLDWPANFATWGMIVSTFYTGS
ncbi:serine/threonine-protein kinase [Actinoplanes sp. N902-109]|uniref:serine/threonine-protein kinase n=1 Tax=Actinoplanes sp. (strain N902-109) TaxID=649831 RepID=UPI0003295BC6|nr:serine/threonine-protein kinase [Actinoplanes sp. N902-109]AGL20278.1 serine/threonine-protein kinase-like domain-containing protein [Actinoplanes sp. N902-109]